MDWSVDSPNAKDLKENLAYDVIQAYLDALQGESNLKGILSEDVVLDYFGEIFYGQDKVAEKIMECLQESNYDVSSVTVSDESIFECNLNHHSSSKTNSDVFDNDGVTLISPPKTLYSGLALVTPPSTTITPQVPGKRSWKTAALDDLVCNLKRSKIRSNSKGDTFCSSDFGFPPDMHHLMAEGTIRYPKKRSSTSDPKRARRSSSTKRDKYCKMHLGFQLQPSQHGGTSLALRCKVRAVRYHVSSRYNPRNLLNSFNQVA